MNTETVVGLFGAGAYWVGSFVINLLLMLKVDAHRRDKVPGYQTFWISDGTFFDFVVLFLVSLLGPVLIGYVAYDWYRATHPPKTKLSTLNMNRPVEPSAPPPTQK